MIWNRFIASQMNPALIEETSFDIRAGKYQLKAKGEVIKFDGFLKLFQKQDKEEKADKKDKILPKAKAGEILKLHDIESKQNFTQPPPRYTEGKPCQRAGSTGNRAAQYLCSYHCNDPGPHLCHQGTRKVHPDRAGSFCE